MRSSCRLGASCMPSHDGLVERVVVDAAGVGDHARLDAGPAASLLLDALLDEPDGPFVPLPHAAASSASCAEGRDGRDRASQRRYLLTGAV